MSRARWTKIVLLGGAGLLAVVCGVLMLGPFVQPLRHDWILDGEVMGVAMDWRDFGEEKAAERLSWAIQSKGLHRSLSREACTLSANESGDRHVVCAWSVEVFVPVIGWEVPLEFNSAATADRNGEIHAK